MKPILLALAICTLPAFNASAVETKKLDPRPAAEARYGVNWENGLYKGIKEKEFERLARIFDPRSFQRWQRKLDRISVGMKMADVVKKLGPRKVGANVCGDCCMELDDAYSVVVSIGTGERLTGISSHPLAISYWVLKEGELPFRVTPSE